MVEEMTHLMVVGSKEKRGGEGFNVSFKSMLSVT